MASTVTILLTLSTQLMHCHPLDGLAAKYLIGMDKQTRNANSVLPSDTIKVLTLYPLASSRTVKSKHANFLTPNGPLKASTSTPDFSIINLRDNERKNQISDGIDTRRQLPVKLWKREITRNSGDKKSKAGGSSRKNPPGKLDLVDKSNLLLHAQIVRSSVDAAETKSLGGSVHGGVNNISPGGRAISTITSSKSYGRLIHSVSAHSDNNHYQENPSARHPNFMNSISPLALTRRREDDNDDGSQQSNSSQQPDRALVQPDDGSRSTANGEKIKDSLGTTSSKPLDLSVPSYFPHDLQVRGGPGVGTPIQCLCDTLDCLSMNEPTCRTFGSCYTQTLRMLNGSVSVIRGCISGQTPLLCENRRPKLVKIWPYLTCCKTELCNWDEKFAALIYARVGKVFTAGQTNLSSERPNVRGWSASNVVSVDATGQDAQHCNHTLSQKDKSVKKRFLHEETIPVISPLAAVFLSGGAVIIITISVIGFVILRKESRNVVRNDWTPNDLETFSDLPVSCPRWSDMIQQTQCGSTSSHGGANLGIILDDVSRAYSGSSSVSLETCLVHSAMCDEEDIES